MGYPLGMGTESHMGTIGVGCSQQQSAQQQAASQVTNLQGLQNIQYNSGAGQTISGTGITAGIGAAMQYTPTPSLTKEQQYLNLRFELGEMSEIEKIVYGFAGN